MEEIPVNETPLKTCIEHVKLALNTLKRHQTFAIIFTGDDEKVTFTSSKASLNGFVKSIDLFDASVLYFECLSMARFSIQNFQCNPHTAYHLVYKR